MSPNPIFLPSALYVGYVKFSLTSPPLVVGGSVKSARQARLHNTWYTDHTTSRGYTALRSAFYEGVSACEHFLALFCENKSWRRASQEKPPRKKAPFNCHHHLHWYHSTRQRWQGQPFFILQYPRPSTCTSRTVRKSTYGPLQNKLQPKQLQQLKHRSLDITSASWWGFNTTHNKYICWLGVFWPEQDNH